ncbi:hypothetical protein ACJMK2_007493 [Sinanodonta woodiana]|uniref:DUF7789 domain-containing protein n=1 Tax=Sinanodonta woodiana TaxID=1069815 RepID=A0ABD3VIP3_SINWO
MLLPIPPCISDLCRKFRDLNKKEIVFLLVSTLSILSCFCLTIERMVSVDKSSPDFTFTVVIVVNLVFCSYYIATGIFLERPYDVMMFIIGAIIILIYLIVNYSIGTTTPYRLARLISACVLCPIIVLLGVYLAWNYYRSGKLIFRTVGAVEKEQVMYKIMYKFFGLLQLDLQLGASLTVLVLKHGDDVSKLQIGLVCAVGILTLSSSLSGYFGVRLENRKLMHLYALLWICLPCYAVFNIVQTAIDLVGNTPAGKESLGQVTCICCSLSICTRALILYFGCKVYRSFGNGLKEKEHDLPLQLIKDKVRALRGA